MHRRSILVAIRYTDTDQWYSWA